MEKKMELQSKDDIGRKTEQGQEVMLAKTNTRQ